MSNKQERILLINCCGECFFADFEDGICLLTDGPKTIEVFNEVHKECPLKKLKVIVRLEEQYTETKLLEMVETNNAKENSDTFKK